MDEPTGNLDQETRQLLLNTLIKLKKQGKGIVIVSHDIEFQLSLCDRVLVLIEGKIQFEGTPYTLMNVIKERDWNFFQLPDIFLFVESLTNKYPNIDLLSNYFNAASIEEKLALLADVFVEGQ